MQTDVRFLKPLVEKILRQSEQFSWSYQGFGMLRTYLGPANDVKAIRLNIWDSRFAVPNVSTVHDHPWHFNSLIVAGAFVNVRYLTSEKGHATHRFVEIKTGDKGGIEPGNIPQSIRLLPKKPELYCEGDTYKQTATEIHESIPYDGTVTINERMRVGDGEHARVFWPLGQEWVDAIPRAATPEEVRTVCNFSLDRWF